MNKRALGLLIFAALVLGGLAWGLHTLKGLQEQVRDHGARIEWLEVVR